MKSYNSFYFSILLIVSLIACKTANIKANKPKAADIETAYFGEKEPKLIPKHFNPKILSPNGNFEGGTYSPDMKEFYFTRKNGEYKKRTFFVIRNENNSWSKEEETEIKWPQFSMGGDIMYIGKKYRLKTETGWSESKEQGEFLKDMAHGMSVSSNGTYYFAVYKKEDMGINGSIYTYSPNENTNENPIKLGPEINTGTYIAHPFIAPDESYIMWDMVRDDGLGEADIYISFKQKNGSWLPAINMGEIINSPLQESSPSISPDGKYLFFMRTTEKTREDGTTYEVVKQYWVDSRIIENLR